MMPHDKEGDTRNTPLTDTVDEQLLDEDDAAEEIRETGEPFGGNFA